MIYYHLFISNIIHFCMNLIGYMIFFLFRQQFITFSKIQFVLPFWLGNISSCFFSIFIINSYYMQNGIS